MSAPTLRRDYANSLLSDLAVSRASLPRRDVLTGWLRDYVGQPRAGDREAEPATATENLLAINAHLLAFAIPGSDRPRLE